MGMIKDKIAQFCIEQEVEKIKENFDDKTIITIQAIALIGLGMYCFGRHRGAKNGGTTIIFR